MSLTVYMRVTFFRAIIPISGNNRYPVPVYCIDCGTLRLLVCSLICSSFAIFYAYASIETDVV